MSPTPPDTPFGTEASVICPHCGEHVVIAVDPAGGSRQEYVEDCEVCCRPWHVSVWFDESGVATVQLDLTD